MYGNISPVTEDIFINIASTPRLTRTSYYGEVWIGEPRRVTTRLVTQVVCSYAVHKNVVTYLIMTRISSILANANLNNSVCRQFIPVVYKSNVRTQHFSHKQQHKSLGSVFCHYQTMHGSKNIKEIYTNVSLRSIIE
jgi:hypothetical protein